MVACAITPAMHARFVDPMLLLPTDRLPADEGWEYQLKLDGYRAIAFNRAGRVCLRSRNDKDFGAAYPAVVSGLRGLPRETVIDGEIVAVDADGRPSFQLLQHGAGASLLYYVFDVMVLDGGDVMGEPFTTRRTLLETRVLPHLAEPVRYVPPLDAALPVLIESIRAHGLEGLVAKRRTSRYEPGLRTGAWRKMRVNRGQDFVIGGYTIGASPFDALIVGYYEGGGLRYAARTRSGFTPAARAALWRAMRPLETPACPFVDLPESRSGRWGQGLTAQKMGDCRWLRPVLVARCEFVEWTADHHLRHVRFAGLQPDRDAASVTRE
jgi:bifunctional non-homologous end joining protein LigD